MYVCVWINTQLHSTPTPQISFNDLISLVEIQSSELLVAT